MHQLSCPREAQDCWSLRVALLGGGGSHIYLARGGEWLQRVTVVVGRCCDRIIYLGPSGGHATLPSNMLFRIIFNV